jgi:beta-lactamase class D
MPEPTRHAAFAVLAFLLIACSGAPPADHTDADPAASSFDDPELGRFFEGMDGTFVLFDEHSGRTVRHDPERAQRRFLPASTFKIPNTLIALETDVATGPDFGLAWDSLASPRQEWWPEAWARDHDLSTALPSSVVWYYQELARRIGPDRMEAYLEAFGYGNHDISGGIDQFWLTGDLRITAHEQVDFLRRLRHREVGFAPDVVATVEELMVLERCPEYTLRGKTGWVEPGGVNLGWLVGWIERDGAVHYYAMNLETPVQGFPMVRARQEIVRGILRELGIMPAPCGQAG